MEMTEEENCPECGGETEIDIDYVMGHKTAAGRSCVECDWEVIW